jgi:hypothetical protein
MNYNEINELLAPLINNKEWTGYEIDVTFHEDENVATLNGEFRVVFKSNATRSGELFIGHVFKLDLDHIRLKLKSKSVDGVTLPDFSIKEIIDSFAIEIGIHYLEFKDWLYCYNKSANDYDKIMEFIVKKRGSVLGRVSGIN